MTQDTPAAERYLEIAERRFAEAGFHGVSLAALASEAGVSKQALLHFFGTKERLYGAVLARLSDRLCAAVDAIAAHSPAETLIAYFDALAAEAIARPTDSRLVVRALLDSDPAARFWPLKPYLEKLTALARQTPRWRDGPEQAAQAGLFHLIGVIQYLTVSAPALDGMFGREARRAIETQLIADIGAAVQEFVAPR